MNTKIIAHEGEVINTQLNWSELIWAHPLSYAQGLFFTLPVLFVDPEKICEILRGFPLLLSDLSYSETHRAKHMWSYFHVEIKD